ncbi:site-specific integrase [Arthrobacter sp. ok362]|uniref:tyrosine-type recombinase/integrase n=1 Tax=Arthrobacter sp. ok362 TaxID=1761745 RepID=UPI00088AE293|nr:site-specific integrase [Arthrobacter sp. ok362]SDK78600.1 Site-specific recombinase XerD [Arthrobacter sp. ok362]
MASIRTRELTKGGSSHTVTWRDPETGLKTRTFSDKDYGPGEARDKALELKAFLDANGNSYKLAATAKVRKDSTAPTVYEVVVRHIDLLRKPQPGTIAKYRNMAAGHIAASELGRTPVDKVNKAAVIDWLDELKVLQGANQTKGAPLSRKSKQNIHALLSAAFVTAVDAETMTRNPAKGVAEADLNEAREAVYLSPEDLVMLAERIDPHYSLFIRFLGGTGLRYSEATALRRRDVTIRDGRAAVRVSRAWKSKGKGEEIGPPKTKKANRTVTCNAALSSALADRLQEIELDDFVFQRPDGDYVRNSRFHKEVWQPLMGQLVGKELDRKPWIHEIRHAHTTHLLDANVPVHVVQARLGHEDPQTTLRVYARLAKASDAAAADALG